MCKKMYLNLILMQDKFDTEIDFGLQGIGELEVKKNYPGDLIILII